MPDLRAAMQSGRVGLPSTPQPGTPEHSLLILVLLEIAALVILRRYFTKGGAHGG